MSRNSDGGLPVLATEKQVAELGMAVRKLRNVRGHGGIIVRNNSESIDIMPARALLDAVGGGGGIGIKTVKVITVNPLFFLCRDVDYATGTEIAGTPFEVYPRVVDAGYTTTYNLTATTGTVVMERFVAGNYLDVYATPMQLFRGISNPPARIWTVDLFHLSSCTVTGG